MAGQGLLYLKVKQGFEFIYNGDAEAESDEDILKSAFDSSVTASLANVSEGPPSITDPVIQSSTAESGSSFVPETELEGTNEGACEILSEADQLVEEIHKQGLSDPVEILRFLQKKLVQGRDLDVTSESELKEGDTNYICVDRHDILGTSFSELASIANFHLTFEVDFMGEKAKDLGGPRKEWIRLMNLAIKEKYFDHGLRQYLADDYYYVGIMMGIALLQNFLAT